MRTFTLLTSYIFLLSISSCKDERKSAAAPLVIASGQMPVIAIDNSGNLNVVYGTGDSIMCSFSKDNGISFSSPMLIDVLPELAASHTRGPQIAVSDEAIIVTACNKAGNIFSYTKANTRNWEHAGKVNDVDTVSKEGLMALSADGPTTFAVWLDLRDKHNKIFGAKSTDGGKTWSKNIMIYASPDTTVCECCKPSVAVKDNNVYVMFRNWLHGSRVLYMIHSSHAGNTFGNAQKLGNGSWALNGCPMDGGALKIDKSGKVFTVWRREGKMFASEPGKQEMEIGEGRSCTMEIVAGRKVYAWIEKGEVVCLMPDGKKQRLGKGQQPVLKATTDKQFICVWENEKKIHRSILEIL
ncbi:MAG: sialidase family protein [Chitinophagaceae bacterium]